MNMPGDNDNDEDEDLQRFLKNLAVFHLLPALLLY